MEDLGFQSLHCIESGSVDDTPHSGRTDDEDDADARLLAAIDEAPCAMCTGAILLYGIPRVVVGENLRFRGDGDLLRSRGVQVEVVQDERCTQMTADFIEPRPELWHEDIGR